MEKLFQDKVTQLKEAMKKDYDSRSDSPERATIEKLLTRNIETQDDYEDVLFRYHGGLLRTQEEIEERNFIKNYNRFDEQRHLRNSYAAPIPFLLVFIICVIPLYQDHWILGIPIALIPALLASLISMIIGYSINKSIAKDLGLENTPAYQDEDNKQKIGIASGLMAGRSIYKNTKKAVKDVMNVDSWKEVK